jgi:hypothetical protein
VALIVFFESPPIQELTISLCTCSHSFTLKMEAIRSSETSVLIRATRRHLPEDDNHHLTIQYYLKSELLCYIIHGKLMQNSTVL